MSGLLQDRSGFSSRLPGNVGMVCGVPFLVALFLLTWGILLLPEYPFASPFLFIACYMIWKKAPAPGLTGYRTLKEVQAAFQDKPGQVEESLDYASAEHGPAPCFEETDDLDKAACSGCLP